MIVSGRVWKVADRCRAIDLLPARHDKAAMTGQWEECARNVLEDARPDIRGALRPGDIVVGADDLGGGHAHYHRGAIMACKRAGLGALFADSVNPLFLRAAIDAGLPVWACPAIANHAADGDELRIDLSEGVIFNQRSAVRTHFKPMPPIVLDVLQAGGSLPWAIRRSSEMADDLERID